MTAKNRWLGTAALILVLISSACKPRPSTEGTDAINILLAAIDAPADGSVLPFQTHQIVVHGAAPDGVSRFELRINGEDFSDVLAADLGHTLVIGRLNWNPPAPGQYVIKLRCQAADGAWSEQDVVEVEISEPVGGVEEGEEYSILLPYVNAGAESEVVQETTAPEPTAEPTIEVTACAPQAVFLVNGNCRRGPSTDYAVVTSLLAGVQVEINARNQDSTWWRITLPQSQATCWVSDVVVETSCMEQTLPWIVAEPLIGLPTLSSTVVHWGSCTLTKLTFQVNVTGESPITEVSITLWNTDQTPNTLQLTKMGETVWSITIDANTDIPGSDMFMTSTLSYYFEAKNQAGLTAKSATYADITLTKCP